MRPDSFSITTFWLDWLLMPLMIFGAWLTVHWALADSKEAADLGVGRESLLPPWAFSIPLFTAAFAWIIAGLGALIKEDYWEMRVIFIAFLLWTICTFAGATLLTISVLEKGKEISIVEIVNLFGLVLMSILMILPGLIDPSTSEIVTLVGHIWFVLLAVSVGLLTAGMFFGYPYKFPQFPLGLGVLFLIGWGLSEVAFSQASFPWLVRIWKLNLGIDYLEAFPISGGWQIAGMVKFLLGFASAAIIFVRSRRKHSDERSQKRSPN